MIRKAKQKDIPAIGELWEEFMKEHRQIIAKGNKDLMALTKLRKGAQKKFTPWASKQIKSPNGLLLVAEKDGKLIGYCLSFIKKNAPVFDVAYLGYISDLYVKKEYRGTGIASAFTTEAKKWFKKKKMRYASLTVWTNNDRAQKIYKKWGYEPYNIVMKKRI